jgi:hypothetical protein
METPLLWIFENLRAMFKYGSHFSYKSSATQKEAGTCI